MNKKLLSSLSLLVTLSVTGCGSSTSSSSHADSSKVASVSSTLASTSSSEVVSSVISSTVSSSSEVVSSSSSSSSEVVSSSTSTGEDQEALLARLAEITESIDTSLDATVTTLTQVQTVTNRIYEGVYYGLRDYLILNADTDILELDGTTEDSASFKLYENQVSEKRGTAKEKNHVEGSEFAVTEEYIYQLYVSDSGALCVANDSSNDANDYSMVYFTGEEMKAYGMTFETVSGGLGISNSVKFYFKEGTKHDLRVDKIEEHADGSMAIAYSYSYDDKLSSLVNGLEEIGAIDTDIKCNESFSFEIDAAGICTRFDDQFKVQLLQNPQDGSDISADNFFIYETRLLSEGVSTVSNGDFDRANLIPVAE